MSSVIIAGSRSIIDYDIVLEAIEKSGYEITRVISGTAPGVDSLGELWAIKHGIPYVRMPANWNKYGKKAGFIRNKEMAVAADKAIIVWDGKSPGSSNMIDEMLALNKPVYVEVIGNCWCAQSGYEPVCKTENVGSIPITNSKAYLDI